MNISVKKGWGYKITLWHLMGRKRYANSILKKSGFLNFFCHFHQTHPSCFFFIHVLLSASFLKKKEATAQKLPFLKGFTFFFLRKRRLNVWSNWRYAEDGSNCCCSCCWKTVKTVTYLDRLSRGGGGEEKLRRFSYDTFSWSTFHLDFKERTWKKVNIHDYEFRPHWHVTLFYV